jgi:hypothetical protein
MAGTSRDALLWRKWVISLRARWLAFDLCAVYTHITAHVLACVQKEIPIPCGSGVTRNCVGGWVQQFQLRTEDRENGDLGAVAP